jgi:large subunit ribosomal protein L18
MKKIKNPRIRRHRRVRKKVIGTLNRPRLAIFRSPKHIYVQAINDLDGNTIVSASSIKPSDLPSVDKEGISGKIKTAMAVGKLIAQRLKDKGIETAVFDRGGFRYHGRVAAIADGARDGGINV